MHICIAKYSGDGTKDLPYSEIETAIQLKKKKFDLFVGNGMMVGYDITPSHRKVALKWSSDEPRIASVNENGVVMGHRIGKTTIRLVSATGQQQSIQVEVKSGIFKPNVKTFTVLKSKNLYGGTVDLEDYYLSPFSDKSGGTAILKDNYKQTHVAYETDKDVRLVVYDRFLKVKKRITFKKEWIKFGDITLDPLGNYYILWGRYLDEQDHLSSSIMITKYDSDGKRMDSISWNGKELDTKAPFNSGNARIVYQKDVLIAHFARQMFAHEDGFNHQSS
ncbi:Ig-like domain-containing protein [Exiguobacterium sp. HVEsp1]|uniref:Ig-like domain-containing protein n=1 Tax=Exiguobacterium sp. HVEsp1 TaxID=1934003 RepID=UPI00143931E5|nr:Ig-like domain-containing protein [Exiguobacterium sp. HVEsp1]